MNIGTFELVIIVVLAIILYGKRLPEITRALGRGYQEFKNNIDNVKNDFQKQVEVSHPSDRLSRADSTSPPEADLPLAQRRPEGLTSEKTDKYYADALNGESAKENDKSIPVTQSEADSKNHGKNLAG
ncbi:MAG: twin-arginine translocase TatA/TatE family subunit [Planctomycetota bacterium]